MSQTATIFCLILASLLTLGYSNPFGAQLIDEPQNEAIDLAPLGALLFSEPDETVGKIVNDWTPEDGQNPEELGSYLEGDMLVPSVEGRNGLVKTSSRWPNGVVPYVIGPGFSSADQSIIQQAIAEYHSKTCLKFVKRTSEKDYLSIESSQTGCWSSVGKVGKRQIVNLQTPGCTTKIGTPIHELMHAVGFLHEQNRYDRDGFVRVLTQNIKPGENVK